MAAIAEYKWIARVDDIVNGTFIVCAGGRFRGPRGYCACGLASVEI